MTGARTSRTLPAMASRTTSTKGIRMPKGEWRRLENEAAKLGITVTDLVRLRLADTQQMGADASTSTPATQA